MQDINEHNELERMAPTLHALPKEDPFVVPNGFFERFPHEVQAQLGATQRHGIQWNWWKRMAIALPVIAVITLGALHYAARSEGMAIGTIAMEPLTMDELLQYNENDLLAATEESELPTLGSVDLQLNKEEALAYFTHEQTDLTELIAEQ